MNRAPLTTLEAGPPRRGEVRFILILALSMSVIPLLFGELFPFSSAPMFRDRPTVYCTYSVTGPDGKSLSLTSFRLQRNYDGNPPGMGTGVVPNQTLDQFGAAPSLKVLKAHVQKVLDSLDTAPDYVQVRQKVMGAIDSHRVGVVSDSTIRVMRSAR